MALIDLSKLTSNTAYGIASKLDTEKILKAKREQAEIPIKKLEDEVKLCEKKIESYSEMKSLLKTFQESAKRLSTSSSIINSNNNVFDERKVTLGTNEMLDYSKYATISAKSKANLRSYKLNIEQLATAKSERFIAGNAITDPITNVVTNRNFGFASSNTNITTSTGTSTTDSEGKNRGTFKAGTFKINGQDITLTAGDTLINICAKINFSSKITKVQANISQVSDNDYILEVSSMTTGIANAYNIDDPDGVLGSIRSGANDTSLVQTPQDAKFKINDIEYVRSTNNIDNAISDVKINLLAPNSSNTSSISINVTRDGEAVTSTIEDFVTTYNTFKQFSAKQQERTKSKDRKFAETAYIGNDNFFKTALSNIQSLLREEVLGIDSTKFPSSLAKLGIKFDTMPADKMHEIVEAPGSLDLDRKILDKELDKDIESVSAVFDFKTNIPDNIFRIVDRNKTLPINKFTIKIKTDNLPAPYSATEKVAFVYKDANNVDAISYADFKPFGNSTGNQSGKITGRKGTIFEGMNISYLGSKTLTLQSFDTEFSQGVADKSSNALDGYLKYDGLIQNEINLNTKKIENLNNEIENKKQKIDREEKFRMASFGRVEQQAAQINKNLGLLQALSNSDKNN